MYTQLLSLITGVFDINESHLHLTICPQHRDDYGIHWLTSKKNCACPVSWAPHKNTPRKGDRGLTLLQSRKLYDYTSTVVPIGSRKYSYAFIRNMRNLSHPILHFIAHKFTF